MAEGGQERSLLQVVLEIVQQVVQRDQRIGHFQVMGAQINRTCLWV